MCAINASVRGGVDEAEAGIKGRDKGRSGFAAEHAAGAAVSAVPPGIVQIVDTDRLPAPRRMDEPVVAQEDAYVVKSPPHREEDQVARLQLIALDVDAGRSLVGAHPRQGDAQLPVHVEGQAAAVEPLGPYGAPAVRLAHLSAGQLGHTVARRGIRCQRIRGFGQVFGNRRARREPVFVLFVVRNQQCSGLVPGGQPARGRLGALALGLRRWPWDNCRLDNAFGGAAGGGGEEQRRQQDQKPQLHVRRHHPRCAAENVSDPAQERQAAVSFRFCSFC